VSQALDFWISNTEKEVVLAADAMPEEKYSAHQPRVSLPAPAFSPSKSNIWLPATTVCRRIC
jgi:hypothetical protein